MMEVDLVSPCDINIPVLHENNVQINSNQITTDYHQEEFVDLTVIYSFKRLLKRYKKLMEDSDVCIVSGGLQQYLNRKRPDQQSQKCHPSDDSFFNALPVNTKLKIFGYLNVKDLCRITRVCKCWKEICEDNLLWHNLLNRDIVTWEKISHMTNPALYKEVQSDWSNKEIYLKCSPEVRQLMHQENTLLNGLNNILRYFMPKKVPKIAMFGPGLESDTSGLVRKMLYDENVNLARVSMVPGQFDGVGSGWCMKMQNGQLFQLSILYSASKKVRSEHARNRYQNNGLLEVRQGNDGQQTVEVKPAVRDFLRTVDAFVYVVDASRKCETVGENRDELLAMVSEQWFSTHVPVLVMSCVPEVSNPCVACIDVVGELKMSQLSRPWQVQNCVVETLEGVIEGIQWLVEQSSRR